MWVTHVPLPSHREVVAVPSAHVGAALWHHFGARDEVLRRMWPGTRARGSIETRDEPVDRASETKEESQ